MAVRRLGWRVVSAQGEGRKTHGSYPQVKADLNGIPELTDGVRHARRWPTREEDGVTQQLRVYPVGPAKLRHTSNAKMADPMTAGIRMTAGHQTRMRAHRG
jgi:hypothetical protein